MSYSALGGVGPDCAYLQTMMPGTDTFMPGEICPVSTGKTGDHPPKPRWCDGPGTWAVQQGLIQAGLVGGGVQVDPAPSVIAAMAAVATKYKVPWNGDVWNVPLDLCRAIATEISERAPSCEGEWPTVDCVVPVKNRYRPGAPLVPPPPSTLSSSNRGAAPLVPTPPPPPASQLSRLVVKPADSMTRRYIGSRFTTGPTVGRRGVQPSGEGAPGMSVQTVSSDGEGASADTRDGVVGSGKDSVPTWVYYAGGAAALGMVALVTMGGRG